MRITAKFDRSKVPGQLRLFCPNELVESVADLSPDYLKSLGIKAIGLDLDNTLTPWKSYDCGEGIEDWMASVKAAGFKLVLISNSRRKKRLAELSERFNIPYVKGPMKPRPVIFKTALELLQVKPSEMAMVGDQMFTDVWGGNLSGLYTIWVHPIHPREFFGTKFSRGFEKFLTKKLMKYKVETPSAAENVDRESETVDRGS